MNLWKENGTKILGVLGSILGAVAMVLTPEQIVSVLGAKGPGAVIVVGGILTYLRGHQNSGTLPGGPTAKSPLLVGVLVALAVMAAFVASMPAQAAPVPLRIDYTLPTAACSTVNGTPVTPCDNLPLTGANALTGVDVYISKTPIADNAIMAPTLTLAANVTTGTSTFAASDGDKLYVRLKARTAGASSVFSNQGAKDVVVAVTPNAPIIVTINIG